MSTAPLSALLGELRRNSDADLPDAELLRRYRQQRDEAAFAALLRRHGPLVMSACRRQLGWSAGAVKGRLERGRLALRGRLERRGVTLSAGLLAVISASRSDAVPPELVNSLVRTLSDPAAAPSAAAALAEGVPLLMNP